MRATQTCAGQKKPRLEARAFPSSAGERSDLNNPSRPGTWLASLLSFWQLCHHRLGGDQEAGDRGRVLQCGAHYLGGIDDALCNEVRILAGLGVEAVIVLVFSRIFPTMTEPSSPALMTIWRAGQESAFLAISTPCFWSSFCVLILSSALMARSNGTRRRRGLARLRRELRASRPRHEPCASPRAVQRSQRCEAIADKRRGLEATFSAFPDESSLNLWGAT